MQINKLMKLGKKLAVVATVAMTMAIPLTAYAAPSNFNAEYYAAQNPDVVKVYGSSYEALARHYDMFGLYEGRNAYVGDTKAAFIRLANAHYASGTGLASVFDAKWYAAHNPDAVKEFGNDPYKLFEHFVIYGLAEGRMPSETFNAEAFFSENGALAAVVAKAFEDVPTASETSFVQIAKQVTESVNPVVANPVANVVTETTNNNENNTPSNNNPSNVEEESTTTNNQSVNKLEVVRQMTAQSNRSAQLLTRQATSMNNKVTQAQEQIAAIKSEIAAAGGNMTQEQKAAFQDRINAAMALATSAQEEAIVLSRTAEQVHATTDASCSYAYNYYTELNATKNTLVSKQSSLEQQKITAEEALAVASVNFGLTTEALNNAQAALDNATAVYADALSAVAALKGQKTTQAAVVAQAQAEFQAAEKAVLNAANSNQEVQRLLYERQLLQDAYDNMSDELKNSSSGETMLQEINNRTAQANQIGNAATEDLRTDLVNKGNAYNYANNDLTNINNQLADAESACAEAYADKMDASADFQQAKANNDAVNSEINSLNAEISNLDAQITSTTEAITQVENTMSEVESCGIAMAADRATDYGVMRATDNVLGDTGVSTVLNDAEDAREDVANATIVPPTTPDENSTENTSEENTSENNSYNQD